MIVRTVEKEPAQSKPPVWFDKPSCLLPNATNVPEELNSKLMNANWENVQVEQSENDKPVFQY